MGTILWIVFWAVVLYGCYKLDGLTQKMRDNRFKRQKSKITEDKIKDQWTAIIGEAKGRGDELIERIARRVKDDNIPHVQIAKRLFSIDGAASLPFLVVSNDKLKGYEILVGAFDYGDRLNVLVYLIFDSPEHMEIRDAAQHWREVSDNQHTKWALFAASKGYTAPENLSILKRQELENYIAIVQSTLKDEVKQMMNGRELDFTKVDKHTKGFLNLS